jgi:TatA/E family protein of Tat protein translocase
MPNIGAPELIIILVIALLILGPGKLPEVGASIGKSIREFRKASSDLSDSVNVSVDTSPPPPPPPPPAPPPRGRPRCAARGRRAGCARGPGCPHGPGCARDFERAGFQLELGPALRAPDGRRRHPSRTGLRRHPI